MDVCSLTREMVGFARNEIFARHANLFRTKKYADHYSQYAWYRNIPNKWYHVSLDDLNQIERANVARIQSWEAG